MSGIGGLLEPGRPAADGEVVAWLARGLARRGPDGGAARALDEVEMVHRELYTAGRPTAGAQPFLHEGRLLLAWDGRLDNASELEAALGAAAGPAGSDLALLARAYERWGVGLPARLVGDFALALWDLRQRRLLLARDPFGVRPLFYAARGAGLVWASTCEALLAALGLAPEVDDDWVAAFLSYAKDTRRTPYRGICALPPAHRLCWHAGEVRLERYWRADPGRSLSHASDGEYEEHFRELFLSAVACRLDTPAPVFAELSGGLDSSSIVCAADHLLRRGRARAPDLLTFSEVFELSSTSDELAYVRAVEERTGRRSHHITEAECPILAGLGEVPFEVPTTLQCFKQRHLQESVWMCRHGARVLLSGVGGDQLLVSEVSAPVELADLAIDGRFSLLPAALAHWHREQGKPYLELLWKGLVEPLLPARLRWRGPAPAPLPDFYGASFAPRVRQAAAAARIDEGGFRLPSKRRQAAAVETVVRTVAWKYDLGGEPLELSYPFLDRRLVEFCLSIPSQQLVRPGETRSIHRRALAPLLPPEVAWRRNKRGPYEAILRAFATRWTSLEPFLARLRVCERGYVDPSGFGRALAAARFGRGFNLLLVHAIALECWLRRLETRPPGGG